MPLANLIRDTATLWSRHLGWNKGCGRRRPGHSMAARDARYAACGPPIIKSFRFPKEAYPSCGPWRPWRASVRSEKWPHP